MPKFRKKPVEIEAMQFETNNEVGSPNMDAICNWANQGSRAWVCARKRRSRQTPAWVGGFKGSVRNRLGQRKRLVVGDSQRVRVFAFCQASAPLYHDGTNIYVRTLEGVMRADVKDWIIKGVKSEFYPCKPDIFAATYDPA